MRIICVRKIATSQHTSCVRIVFGPFCEARTRGEMAPHRREKAKIEGKEKTQGRNVVS